jgi:2-haloacid dehalogenase
MSDTHLARSNSMSINRRKFLEIAFSTVTASGLLTATAAATDAKPAIKAIAFDGFPIFDPRPIFAMAEELFPGRGAQ